MGEVDDNLLLQRTLLKLTSKLSTGTAVCLWCASDGTHAVMQMLHQWHAGLLSHADVLCLQD